MYQICSKCKQPVTMVDAVCPRCDTELVDSIKSRRRDTIYNIIGGIALAVTAFFEMDLSDYDDTMQGEWYLVP